jgi:hypothetical protein
MELRMLSYRAKTAQKVVNIKDRKSEESGGRRPPIRAATTTDRSNGWLVRARYHLSIAISLTGQTAPSTARDKSRARHHF